MTLGELIQYLERVPPDTMCPVGFLSPHSYRGFYDEVAFRPSLNVLVSEMLAAARMALGGTFTGYKGGEYIMGEHTAVWVADWGCLGEQIGPILLSYMVGRPSLEDQ